jgi:hypothetical protein
VVFNVAKFDFLQAIKVYKVIKGDTVNLKRYRYVMELFDRSIFIEKVEKYYTIIE